MFLWVISKKQLLPQPIVPWSAATRGAVWSSTEKTSPTRSFSPPPPPYKTIHQAVAQAIQESGTPCRLATAQPKEDDPSCFLKPVPADVLDSAGHKLAGAAQRRTKQGCLHQGSILFPKTLPPRLIELLPICLASCLQDTPAPSTLTSDELQQADQLEKDRYSTREWNYSR